MRTLFAAARLGTPRFGGKPLVQHNFSNACFLYVYIYIYIYMYIYTYIATI